MILNKKKESRAKFVLKNSYNVSLLLNPDKKETENKQEIKTCVHKQAEKKKK